jgi:competence protein ComFC
MLSAARFFWRTTLDFIYPPLCLLCDRYLSDEEPLVHRACLAALPQLDDEDLSGAALSKTLRFPPFFERSLALHPFSDRVGMIIHALKYKGLQDLARPLGRSLGQLLADLDYTQEIDLLVPVPLHRHRLRERGYNQSLLLARAASEVCGVPVEEGALIRHRSTPPQARLRRRQRQENLTGAFRVIDAGRLRGTAIGLLDDVLTTGRTADECSRTLLEAGASRVMAVTLARVV